MNVLLTASHFQTQSNFFDFFSLALDAPPVKKIQKSIHLLSSLHALEKEHLTDLGRHLSSLGMDVRLGELLMASEVCLCLDPILTIVSAQSTKSNKQSSTCSFPHMESDLLEFANQYSQHSHTSHHSEISVTRKELLKRLVATGLIKKDVDYNVLSSHVKWVRAVLSSGSTSLICNGKEV
jgi:HrpA-like RNA helicase